MKKLLILVSFVSGCTSPQILKDNSDYLYYVIDVNGTEPDASFEDRKDAQKYVDKFKEFHEYRIVKAQSYTNTNDK